MGEMLSEMGGPLTMLLGQVLLISITGVCAPGPITAATIAGGTRQKHAGALIAVGHGVIEFPLMLMIITGAGVFLTAPAFRIGAGLVGGAALLALGVLTLISIRSAGAMSATVASTDKPRRGSVTIFSTGSGTPLRPAESRAGQVAIARFIE